MDKENLEVLNALIGSYGWHSERYGAAVAMWNQMGPNSTTSEDVADAYDVYSKALAAIRRFIEEKL